jgi:hypothetical protein
MITLLKQDIAHMVRVMRPSLARDRRPAVAADNGADASVGCATGEPPD